MTAEALLVSAVLLPLASFAVLVFFGKRLGDKSAWIGTGFSFLTFVLSVWAYIGWMGGHGHHTPILREAVWVPASFDGSAKLSVSIFIDGLTVLMFAMVSLVAFLVHVFSVAYMKGDPRYPRFFAYLGLFCFSMLGLLLGGTLLQLFIFWELVGLCSYLLIGFWYEKKSASDAAMKAFIVNRVGDFGFLIGLGLLFAIAGNASLPELWQRVAGGDFANREGLLTIIGLGLFCGAVGKSAQFPLHVWLPDAMEGPTPVSALIHAATMVAAGVYLVGRVFPLLTATAMLVIAVVGLITLTMAALIALAQTDIKKVLAYSTLSQLGYMMLALGLGSWVGGLFHLITHAFFKALLFLGSGSVIHAAHHEQEMSEYGGLWRKLPVTAATFAIAVLAIAGTPFFSGFYSKDMILANAAAKAGIEGKALFWVFFAVPTVIAYVTAFYMTRCWMLTFGGKPRNHHVYDHAHETTLLWVPLVVLAVLSVIGGYSILGVEHTLKNTIVEDTRLVTSGLKPFASALATHAEEAPEAVREAYEHAHHLVVSFVTWAFVVGTGLGVLVYWKGYAVPAMLMRVPPLRWAREALYRRLYFDELYDLVFVRPVLALARSVSAFDRLVVDMIVNMVATVTRGVSLVVGFNDRWVVDGAIDVVSRVTWGLGTAGRKLQSGSIRDYLLFALLALALAGIGAIVVQGTGR